MQKGTRELRTWPRLFGVPPWPFRCPSFFPASLPVAVSVALVCSGGVSLVCALRRGLLVMDGAALGVLMVWN
jgi:hypothetical protein